MGAEAGHGQANRRQLNWFLEKGALTRNTDGTYTIEFPKFTEAAKDLANAVLTTEIEGDYERAGQLIAQYGKMTPEIDEVIGKLADIPRDLNTCYTTPGVM